MSEGSQTPKRKPGQHFTPALHLRRFTGDAPKNMVWTYDMQRATCRPSRPEETGKQRNFYSWQKEDGTYMDDLDQWFEGVEGRAGGPYEQLLAGEIPEGQARADFCTFISSLHLRSPAMLHAFATASGKLMQQYMNVAWGTRERFEQSLDKMDKDLGTTTTDRDGLWDFFNDKSGYAIQVDHLAGIAVIGASDSIQQILFHRHWTLLDAAEDFFITSDAPVQRFTPKYAHYGPYGDGGFTNPAAEITMPLSPTRALLITGQPAPQTRVFLGAFGVQHFNRQRAAGAHRYLFADRKHPDVEALAREHKDDGPAIRVGREDRLAEVEVIRATGRRERRRSTGKGQADPE